jgi:hypothetical protein
LLNGRRHGVIDGSRRDDRCARCAEDHDRRRDGEPSHGRTATSVSIFGQRQDRVVVLSG